jgi:hypothetical protein
MMQIGRDIERAAAIVGRIPAIGKMARRHPLSGKCGARGGSRQSHQNQNEDEGRKTHRFLRK